MKIRSLSEKRLIFIFTLLLLTCSMQGISYGQTLTASTPQALTEYNLEDAVVTLTLTSRTYEEQVSPQAVTVSGIAGVSLSDVTRESDTVLKVKLAFPLIDFDADATLTFSVKAAAIARYDGAPLTAKIPVIGVAESLSALPVAPLTETNLDAGVVRLLLEGGTWKEIDYIRNAVTVSGINGVTIEKEAYTYWVTPPPPPGQYWIIPPPKEKRYGKRPAVRRVNDTVLEVLLAFDRTNFDFDTDAALTFTVKANTIANYKGAELTAQVPVTAVTGISAPDLVIESVQVEPATVAPGETFRLYATLKNSGTGESTATTLRYYRSTDAVISTADTQLLGAARDPLAANATIRRYLNVTAPTTPGTYYYGACVDSVTDESDTDNNCSSAVSVTVTAPPEVSADVNEDGIVDVQDLVSVAQQYGQTGTTTADVNDDGVVNIDDLILVAAVLDADAAAAPSLHSGALDLFTVEDVKIWLSQAQQRDLTDPSVQRGILFLEQLLASMVPKETALLANYPNPFNPETWIPYQLAKDVDVTLTIYAVDGQVIRRLALGHQPAGMYQNRSRAAYWDGRNAFGEPVASGVYFYTLTAGDFTVTRKMLIRK